MRSQYLVGLDNSLNIVDFRYVKLLELTGVLVSQWLIRVSDNLIIHCVIELLMPRWDHALSDVFTTFVQKQLS